MNERFPFFIPVARQQEFAYRYPEKLTRWQEAIRYHHGLMSVGAKLRHRPHVEAAFISCRRAYEEMTGSLVALADAYADSVAG